MKVPHISYIAECHIDDDAEIRIRKWNEHKRIRHLIEKMAPSKKEAITEESIKNFLKERENRYRLLVLHDNEHY